MTARKPREEEFPTVKVPHARNQSAQTQAMKVDLAQPRTVDDLETTTVRIKEDGEDTRPRGTEWALVAYAGTSLGRIFPLKEGATLLGRSPEADIALLDPEVSRHHARITLERAADEVRLWLEDLGSTNGTRLNGLASQGPVPLRSGDRLSMGGHVLKVVALDPLERAFHETLLDQSTKDSLTGLANRGATLAELRTRFELALRHNRPLSVVIVDLDYFKRINDTHGHGAGDFVLRSFGERVQSKLRGADLAGRIGGEEFLVVLSETDTEGAMRLAERLRAAVADTPHALPNGTLAATCSLGVAERLPADRTPGDLIGRADAALYRAKQAGRNRVEAAPVE